MIVNVGYVANIISRMLTSADISPMAFSVIIESDVLDRLNPSSPSIVFVWENSFFSRQNEDSPVHFKDFYLLLLF